MSVTVEQQRAVLFEVRVGLLGLFLHITTQISHIHCPWPEKFQRILSIVVLSSIIFIPLRSPSIYLKHKEALFLVWKIAFYSFPLLRQAKGIQRALDVAATPGGVGMFLDLLKVTWGVRFFALLWITLTMRQSLVLFAIGQIYGVVMLRSNTTLCRTRILTDPLSQARMRAFNMLSTNFFLPPGPLRFSWWSYEGGDCSFFLTIYMLGVGVVLPVTLMALGQQKYGSLRKFAVWYMCAQLTWAVSIVFTIEAMRWFPEVVSSSSSSSSIKPLTAYNAISFL